MKKRKPKHHIQPQLQDQAVWMSLAAVFLLFFIGIISFSDHSSLTSAAVQNIAFVKAGTELDFGVKEIPGLERYFFEVRETIKNGQMRVEQDETIPFDQPYYSKFRISSAEEDKIGTVRLQLKVEQQLLHSKGISQGDLRVFHNGEEVETIFTKQEERYFYYTATTPGVGEFVIGKAALAEEAGSTEEAIVPALKEIPAETITTIVPEEFPEEESTPLAGQAAAEPAAKRGFWAGIKSFFSELFG